MCDNSERVVMLCSDMRCINIAVARCFASTYALFVTNGHD